MTFAQRLHQEGHLKGRQEGRREAILEVLEVRFGQVPPGLREEIEAVDDTARLSHLHRSVIRCADLEAFSREL